MKKKKKSPNLHIQPYQFNIGENQKSKVLKKLVLKGGSTFATENKDKNYIRLLRNHESKKKVDWNI